MDWPTMTAGKAKTMKRSNRSYDPAIHARVTARGRPVLKLEIDPESLLAVSPIQKKIAAIRLKPVNSIMRRLRHLLVKG